MVALEAICNLGIEMFQLDFLGLSTTPEFTEPTFSGLDWCLSRVWMINVPVTSVKPNCVFRFLDMSCKMSKSALLFSTPKCTVQTVRSCESAQIRSSWILFTCLIKKLLVSTRCEKIEVTNQRAKLNYQFEKNSSVIYLIFEEKIFHVININIWWNFVHENTCNVLHYRNRCIRYQKTKLGSFGVTLSYVIWPI